MGPQKAWNPKHINSIAGTKENELRYRSMKFPSSNLRIQHDHLPPLRQGRNMKAVVAKVKFPSFTCLRGGLRDRTAFCVRQSAPEIHAGHSVPNHVVDLLPLEWRN